MMAPHSAIVMYALLILSTMFLGGTVGENVTSTLDATTTDVSFSSIGPLEDTQTTLYPTPGDVSETVTFNTSGSSIGSTEEIEVTTMGTDRLSWAPVVWTWNMVLQLVLGILGIIGNLLVIIVLFKRRSVSRSTDTLIGALAFADLLTSVLIIPIPEANIVPSTWVGELYCRILYTSFFMWLSVSVSIFTLTTISIERFVAVLFPIKFNRILRKHHVVLAILLIWLAAIVADSFIPLSISVDPNTQSCIYSYSSELAAEVAGVTSFLLHFLFPSLIMLGTQAITAHALYRQALFFGKGGVESGARSTSSYRLLKAKNRVIKLLLIVIIIFIVCWGPNSIGYFLFNVGVIDYTYLYGDLNRILTLLAFCNSCANPFIYTIQYPQFRVAIKELFTGSMSSFGALFEGFVESPNLNNSAASYEDKNNTQMTAIPVQSVAE
ncbi:allatostatin-A receptor-like [Lytechinus pictus]|uniref:allatostatin-A receptor-like n=1 Tax=Lytechinus pictus TaxID=7653 RepID=UPI0030B9F640